jgi:hypothetical protein
MRDLHILRGPKRRVADVDEALRLVREQYPSALREGCVGAWGFYLDVESTVMVAEMWLTRDQQGWWLGMVP